MKSIVLFFLLLSSCLRADWDQLFSDTEDPSLFHHVNVISGNLNLHLQDTIVEGAKPFPIFRTYSSSGALEPASLNSTLSGLRQGFTLQGGWNFFPHTHLLLDVFKKFSSFQLYLPEPSGSLIPYVFDRMKKGEENVYVFKPKKEFGQCSGALSAKTSVSNYVLEFHPKRGKAVLFLPDGGMRVYRGEAFRRWKLPQQQAIYLESQGKVEYTLEKELLPSGHWIEYAYSDSNSLKRLLLKNPARSKTLAWIGIDRDKKESPIAFSLRTSDSKTLHYKTLKFREVDYLCDVQGECRAEESSGFMKGRKGVGARMWTLSLGGKVQFQADYYTPSDRKHAEKWQERPEKKPFQADKVRSLRAPLGPSGEMIPLAQFTYHPGKTEVVDENGRLIRYHHDGTNLLSTEYCDESGQILSILKFLWEGNRLKAKALLNAAGKALFSKTFSYDAIGNVVRETLWGSLTGKIEGPFSLNSDGSLEGAEHYSKSYQYLPKFNLPLLEEEDSGLSYRYTYVPGTDLLHCKCTIEQGKTLIREFFFYDTDHLLIAESIDNGSSSDPSDLSGVTHKHIKRYQRHPHSGLITASTELYFDLNTQQEVLLKKVQYTYSPYNRVIQETLFDATGKERYTLYTDYDARGRVIQKTTPLGQKNTYTFDPHGNLIKAKEVGTLEKHFCYDPAGRPSCVSEYDHLGLVKQTHTSFDASGRLVLQTDAKGNATEQSYDIEGRCIETRFPKTIDEEGREYLPTATFTYDLEGNLASNSIAGKTTYTKYNTLRKPTEVIQADGSFLRHEYAVGGPLLKTTYPDGTYTTFTYDVLQRMTSQNLYSAQGALLSAESWTYSAFHLLTYTDARGLTTQYNYDGAGRKIAETAESRTTTYAYDPLGYLEKVTQAEVSKVQIHDIAGRITEEWEEREDGRKENHMEFFYDADNLKIKATRLTSQGIATDHFCYDRELRLSAHINPEGHTAQFLYTNILNPLGQYVLQKTRIDPLGNTTLETQDALGRQTITQRTDPSGNPVSKEELFYDTAGNLAKRISTIYKGTAIDRHICVCWQYDPMGRVLTEIESSGKTTHSTYDLKGRLSTQVLPNGTTLFFQYDGLDRLVERKSSDGTLHDLFLYDKGPDPIQARDLIHDTIWIREYNTFGDILQERTSLGLKVGWTYDAHGRQSSYTLPDGSSILYTYHNGHLREISRVNSSGYLSYTHRYTDFDPNGHVCQEELIDQLGTLKTTRDLLERPIYQDSPWAEHTTTYGPSGLVLQTTHTLLGDKNYAYDPLDQLTREADQSYAFDSLGNPQECTVNASNQILSGPDYHIEYDPNGNPIKRVCPEGITTYAYDALGRLITLTSPNGKRTLYFYDPFSRLFAERTNDEERLYLYDKEQEIGTLSPEGILLELKIVGLGIQGEIGGTVALEIHGRTYAPLHDFQGNIIALIAPNQEIYEAYTCNAFGKEHNAFSPLNPWRFQSKRHTQGLIFFGKRFYDPALGRWLTPDPAGFADGPNLYLYVFNSPLNRLDLFGLTSEALFPRSNRDLTYPEFKMEVPLSAIITSGIIAPISSMLPCKVSISGVQTDWLVSCGHWNKLESTPQERSNGIVNIVDHFHQLVPTEGNTIGLISLQNGIKTSDKEFSQNTMSLRNMIPEGTLLVGMYNPTEGIRKDLIRAIEGIKGKETRAIANTRQFLVAISESIHKINPNMLWLHIAHSDGGATTGNAIEGMTEDQRSLLKEQLYLLGVGPSKPFSLEYARGAVNIYSRQDFITGPFALKYRNDPNYDIRFLRCKCSFSERTGWFADHPYLGKTYQGGQKDEIDDLRERKGFYNGKTR